MARKEEIMDVIDREEIASKSMESAVTVLVDIREEKLSAPAMKDIAQNLDRNLHIAEEAEEVIKKEDAASKRRQSSIFVSGAIATHDFPPETYNLEKEVETWQKRDEAMVAVLTEGTCGDYPVKNLNDTLKAEEIAGEKAEELTSVLEGDRWAAETTAAEFPVANYCLAKEEALNMKKEESTKEIGTSESVVAAVLAEEAAADAFKKM